MAKKQVYQSRNKALGAIVAVLLAIVMCAAAVLGVGFGVYGKNTDDWFKPKHEDSQGQQEQPKQDSIPIEVIQTNGISLLSSSTASAAADGTITKNVKATVTPANATDMSVTWTVKFKNADSTWAKGKNVSDYITLSATQQSYGSLCVVSCKKAFGEQIILTCKANENNEISAQATIDYAKRITGVKFSLLDSNKKSVNAADFSMSDKQYYVHFEPTFSDGTIAETGIHYSYSVWSNADFITAATATSTLKSGMSSTSPIDRSDITGMVITADADLQFKTGLRVAYDLLNIAPNNLRDVNLQNAARKYYTDNASKNKVFMDVKVTIYGDHSTSAEYVGKIKLGTANFSVSVSNISLDNSKLTF